MALKRKASSKSKAKQPNITEHALPLPEKPMELIGKQIDVLGGYWEGAMSAEENTAAQIPIGGQGRGGVAMGAPRRDHTGIGAVGAACGHSVFTE